VRIGAEGNASEAESTRDSVSQHSLGEVHGIGNRNNDKPAVLLVGPVEKIVHDLSGCIILNAFINNK
jgi:hypothetical protein